MTSTHTVERIAAISDEHGRGIIRALPVEDQIAICERIVKFPPDRKTQVWARSVFLDLTKKDLPA